ncbi:MAG: hypothetical protein K0U76_17390 [Actinomycetia bacterium]|nr:hypothetical protein [Actinomycetes bacterium]MCH9760623.1 hypothetical protein [Actinomycetes bacterium]
MAHHDRPTAKQIAVAVLSMIPLCTSGSLIAEAATPASALGDFPAQPQCGPDPVTLIDPCQSLPQPGVTADPVPQVPWDVIDSVLFG